MCVQSDAGTVCVDKLGTTKSLINDYWKIFEFYILPSCSPGGPCLVPEWMRPGLGAGSKELSWDKRLDLGIKD